MKIFEKDYKINFVDENNVFVGFDYSQCCCEDFGWGILTEALTAFGYDNISFVNNAGEKDVEKYIFDSTYFKEFYPNGDEASAAMFRMVNGQDEMFLVLYNCHNGYYGHGFNMNIGGKEIFSGCL